MNRSADPLLARLQRALAPEIRIVRLLGEGSVARVYLGGETALERLVAVKVLKPELGEDATTVQRFLREGRAMARVVHPGVVAVHRVGTMEDGGLPYLVLEYVEGRTLSDLVAAEGALPVPAARRVLGQIAAGLAAAHARRVVHRDVRPDNVLVEEGTGRVVLTDFGIAGIRDAASEIVTRLTGPGEVLGDPRYLSPERLLGEAAREESDVYSLGVVGYEILTLEGPFAGESATARVAAKFREAPRDLARERPGVGDEMAALLARCLAAKPEHRPRAADVAAALGESAAAESPRAPPKRPALSGFLDELRRRRVYRVAAGYLAAIFVILQGADLVLPSLAAPGWVFRALVLACLAGFPLALVLGWLYDLTAEGVRRTRGGRGAGARRVPALLPAVGLVASVALTAIAAWWLLGRR